MSKNNEIEAKIILPEQIYQQLCGDFNIKTCFTQENYYFDTNNGLLKDNNISCRIRLFDNSAEQTLKVPHQNPVQQKFHEATEINDSLPLEQAQNLIKQSAQRQEISFSGNVGHFLQSHFAAASQLHLQTYSKTKRILAVGPQDCELTFDKSQYPDGYQDYELEIENPDPELIKAVLAKLKDKYHIVQNFSNTNQAKIARAFRHRGKM